MEDCRTRLKFVNSYVPIRKIVMNILQMMTTWLLKRASNVSNSGLVCGNRTSDVFI